eukprot:1368679-Rhodomonas_salina.1
MIGTQKPNGIRHPRDRSREDRRLRPPALHGYAEDCMGLWWFVVVCGCFSRSCFGDEGRGRAGAQSKMYCSAYCMTGSSLGAGSGEEKGAENGASALAPAAEEQEAEQTAGDDEMPVDALAEQAQAQLEPADSSPAAVDPNPPSGESESAAEPSMSAPPNAAVEPAVEPASATVSASDQPSTQDTEMPAEEPVAPPLAAEASQSSEGDSAQAPAAKEEDTAPAAEGPDASGASEQAPQQQPELSAAPGVSMYAEED